jgi:hypothetical protein
MKSLAKYLSSLLILLLGAYLHFGANAVNTGSKVPVTSYQLPVYMYPLTGPSIRQLVSGQTGNNSQVPAHIDVVGIIQDYSDALRFEPATDNSERQTIIADVIEAAVEEEEEADSKKQLDKSQHTAPLLFAQIRACSFVKGKIISACKRFSYTSSHRYLVFRVFRI